VYDFKIITFKNSENERRKVAREKRRELLSREERVVAESSCDPIIESYRQTRATSSSNNFVDSDHQQIKLSTSFL